MRDDDALRPSQHDRAAMQSTLVVFGAPDPEAELAEHIARTAGCRVAHAMYEGRRVSWSTAYDAEPVELAEGVRRVVLFECAAACDPGVVVSHCDHHRPGDYGYGRPPAEYLEARSIGQLVTQLEGLSGEPIARPWDLALCAAADHCLGAAYRGECPGVDPDALMTWRLTTRARHQRRAPSELLADMHRAQTALRDAPWIELAPGVRVRDMRSPEPVAELPEAAMRLDMAYVSGPLGSPDGREKYTVSGRDEHVRAFLASWAEHEGLVDTYGDPARGFAGGFSASPVTPGEKNPMTELRRPAHAREN